MERKRLSDVLMNSEREQLQREWSSATAARDFTPLSPGTYRASVEEGTLFNSKAGTPGYKIVFRLCDGEHAGRRLWLDLWLSPAALPLAKRDLAKLGITSPEQLDRPLRPGIVVEARVALRRGDDGT